MLFEPKSVAEKELLLAATLNGLSLEIDEQRLAVYFGGVLMSYLYPGENGTFSAGYGRTYQKPQEAIAEIAVAQIATARADKRKALVDRLQKAVLRKIEPKGSRSRKRWKPRPKPNQEGEQ